jgi:hypothetical protein
MRTTLVLTLLAAALAACGSMEYRHYNANDDPPNFTEGYKDGCATGHACLQGTARPPWRR